MVVSMSMRASDSSGSDGGEDDAQPSPRTGRKGGASGDQPPFAPVAITCARATPTAAAEKTRAEESEDSIVRRREERRKEEGRRTSVVGGERGGPALSLLVPQRNRVTTREGRGGTRARLHRNPFGTPLSTIRAERRDASSRRVSRLR